MWKFVEKLKLGRQNDSARHFCGFPIEYEWKDVPTEICAVRDERVMADGRPAFAWWNEIQMLRQKESELQKAETALRDRFIVLRIAEWIRTKDLLSHDVLVRIRFSLDEDSQFNPEKSCEIVRGFLKPKEARNG